MSFYSSEYSVIATFVVIIIKKFNRYTQNTIKKQYEKRYNE